MPALSGALSHLPAHSYLRAVGEGVDNNVDGASQLTLTGVTWFPGGDCQVVKSMIVAWVRSIFGRSPKIAGVEVLSLAASFLCFLLKGANVCEGRPDETRHLRLDKYTESFESTTVNKLNA